MNCLMSTIQCFFCKRTPKATETDYYIDPKIMLLGTPNFEPHKLQNIISRVEFFEMRKKMNEAGGCWLAAAKFFFVFFLIYSQLCAIIDGGLAIYNIITDDDDDIEIPLIVNVGLFIAPNILLQIFWLVSMNKACTCLSRFFELQNKKFYAARGVSWQTCKTLMYIQISIVRGNEESVEIKC